MRANYGKAGMSCPSLPSSHLLPNMFFPLNLPLAIVSLEFKCIIFAMSTQVHSAFHAFSLPAAAAAVLPAVALPPALPLHCHVPLSSFSSKTNMHAPTPCINMQSMIWSQQSLIHTDAYSVYGMLCTSLILQFWLVWSFSILLPDTAKSKFVSILNIYVC